MQKLHASFMRDLRHYEFCGLYRDIIICMDKWQVDDSNIQLALANVNQYKDKLHVLRNRTRNQSSLKNEELTRTRADYIISLRLRVKSYLRSHLPEDRFPAWCIFVVLDAYDKTYYLPSILPQTILVTEIIARRATDEHFKQAFIQLGLSDLMDAIEELTKEIKKNSRNCLFDNYYSKEERQGLRNAAYRDMKTMIDAINFMYVINRNNEEKRAVAAELIRNIDAIFQIRRTPLRSRQTKSKNKKAIAAAVKELIRMQNNQQKLLPMGVTEEVNPRESMNPPLVNNENKEAIIAPVAPQQRVKTEVTNIINPKLKQSTITKKERAVKRDQNKTGNLPSINLN